MVIQLRKPPYCGENFIRGGFLIWHSAEGGKFWGFDSETDHFLLRKIGSESFEKPKIFRLRRAKSVKELKTLIKSAAGENILGIQKPDKKAPPIAEQNLLGGGFLNWNTIDGIYRSIFFPKLG